MQFIPPAFTAPSCVLAAQLDLRKRRGRVSRMRLFNAIFESRERQADREAEMYLARTGHRFTDSIERELNDRLFNGGWNARR